jgi:hypothetical protein
MLAMRPKAIGRLGRGTSRCQPRMFKQCCRMKMRLTDQGKNDNATREDTGCANLMGVISIE